MSWVTKSLHGTQGDYIYPELEDISQKIEWIRKIFKLKKYYYLHR